MSAIFVIMINPPLFHQFGNFSLRRRAPARDPPPAYLLSRRRTSSPRRRPTTFPAAAVFLSRDSSIFSIKYFDKAPSTYSQKMIDELWERWISYVSRYNQPFNDDDDEYDNGLLEL
ncbi:hypothetical protein RND81_12G068400 [Saponaria officinalis]|uniref:Uncharacterized protein n=1 Tax=Saponaria officinalis TaxID=3572 RepID=A0AAW1H7G7_SAPOF